MLGGFITALVAGDVELHENHKGAEAFVFRTSAAFWQLVLRYALLGFGITAAVVIWVATLPSLKWIPAIAYPVATGIVLPIAKTTLGGAMPGADGFHFALRRMLFFFEPRLQRQINIDECGAVVAFLRPYLEKWHSLTHVKTIIEENVPRKLPLAERLVFLEELKSLNTIADAMSHYLRFVGRKFFVAVFDHAALETDLRLRPKTGVDAKTDVPLQTDSFPRAHTRSQRELLRVYVATRGERPAPTRSRTTHDASITPD
jgi:hypothetical protein